jgi:hypothetical protein
VPITRVLLLAGAALLLALTACTGGATPTAIGASTTALARSSASQQASVSRTSAAPSSVKPAVVPAATVQAPARGTALAVLATLPIKGRAPKTGYSRAQFGQAWTDDTDAQFGHNGCGTRDDILAAQLSAVSKSGRCIVTSGTVSDPYTGAALTYSRGHSTVDIDHVVALGDAWQKGAQQLSLLQRIRLANDPLNLLAVSASANRQKGDGDAATWLPQRASYRCDYVARQVAVKHSYSLWVTQAEHDALARILATCPTQMPPTSSAGRAATAASSKPAPPVTTVARDPSAPTTQAASDVYFANCTAARAAGKAPLYRGQPGYRSGLDRDGDGVACE